MSANPHTAPQTTTNTPSAFGTADDPDDLEPKSSSIQNQGDALLPWNADAAVYFHEEKAKINPPALAAKIAKDLAIRFDERSQSFFQFDKQEGIWLVRSRAQIRAQAGTLIKEIAEKFESSHLLILRTASTLNGVTTLIEGQAGFRSSNYSPIEKLLPVKNGVLHLSEDGPQLLPFRPEYEFTSKVPYPYDPEARCPRFITELLAPVLQDPDDVSLLQRMLGAMLLSGNDAQSILTLSGEGGTGKSALVSTIEALLDRTRITYLRSDKLNGRFETHGFQGRSILVGRDVGEDFLNNSGAPLLKALTGADQIETEQKYGGRYTMTGNFHVLITSNGRLRIKLERDESAWARRLVHIEFKRSGPYTPIPNFSQVLLNDEGPGILNWLIEGHQAYREDLKIAGRIRMTEEQQQRVNNLLQESDGQRAFLKSSIAHAPSTLTVEEIWQAFCEFAHSRQWRIPSKQRFCTMLPDLMLELFGSHRDNHIMRQGSAVRGFRAVGFIAAH